MQKWEYLFVSGDSIGGGHWVPRFVNNQELPNWEIGQSLVLYVKELGEQGWELIAVPPPDYLVFKRPIEWWVCEVQTSFSEMMALPNSQLDTTYWFPWYNNLGLDTQLRFGVP